MILILTGVLALVWGAVWAALLQFTGWGRFMAARRAWLAVAIGLGVDLLLLLVLMPVTLWLQVCAIIAASAIGIIVRSIANEWRDHQELMEAVDGDADPAR